MKSINSIVTKYVGEWSTFYSSELFGTLNWVIRVRFNNIKLHDTVIAVNQSIWNKRK